MSVHAARAHAYENPRAELHGLVPAGVRRVLDLGCASGALGAALKLRSGGVEVVGVESDPIYAARARERLDRVVEADLEALAGDAASLGAFDCLIAADVLEHLRDPWAVLAAFAGLLEPDGRAVISLPNVRYWETLWQVGARGTFPRRDAGIFDRTHLRWFTLTDAYSLVEGAGLRVVDVRRVYRLRPRGSSFDARLSVLDRVPGVRAFFAFQLLIAAERP